MSTSVYTNVEKQELASRLRKLMADHGLSQSDLARAVWGEDKIDSRGYRGAAGRDRINAYYNGRDVPEPQTLAKIAKVLGVSPDYLLAPRVPGELGPTPTSIRPTIHKSILPGPDGDARVRLRIDMLVDPKLAAEVFAKL